MFKPKTLLIIATIILLSLPILLQGRQFARWFTTLGSFTADLRDEVVPITAGNFIDLTNDGFYDGLHFHRVVAGFVIQDGDPLGNGYGGPGYTIPDEFSPLLHHDGPGVLAMAHTSAPNSAGSQYYITLAATPWLDGAYAIFGRVFQGLDVVMAIGNVAVDANDHPINNVYIDSLRVLDLAIYGVSPDTSAVVMFDVQNPIPFSVEAYNPDMSVVYQWFIDDILQPQFTEMTMIPEFSYTMNSHTVKCTTSTEQVAWTTEWQVETNAVGNQDESLPPPELRITRLYPNPFKNRTSLTFNSTKAGEMQISVYDVKGRIVKTDTVQNKTGLNNWTWNGQDNTGKVAAPGVYILKIKAGQNSRTAKAVLLN
jgi:cyclophilin family peptidyl-prolyl cis-trans isomerase